MNKRKHTDRKAEKQTQIVEIRGMPTPLWQILKGNAGHRGITLKTYIISTLAEKVGYPYQGD